MELSAFSNVFFHNSQLFSPLPASQWNGQALAGMQEKFWDKPQTPKPKTQIPKPKAQAQPLSLEPVQIRVGRVEAALEAFPQHRPPGGTVILQGI